MHAFDRRTDDRRTDRNLIARPRLHSMQRGKNAKLTHKGSCGGHVAFGILGPLNISGTNEATNFKFGTEMDGSEY